MMKRNLTLLLTLFIGSVSQLPAATLTISTTTNSRDIPLDAASPSIVPLAKGHYSVQVTDLDGQCVAPGAGKIKFNHPIPLDCTHPNVLDMKVFFSGEYAFTLNQHHHTLKVIRQPKVSAHKVFKRPLPKVQCATYKGGPVTIQLQDVFAEGTQLREVFSQQIVTVHNQRVSLVPDAGSNGLLLFEKIKEKPESEKLNWRNANIYFVLIDRFKNGDVSNDHSYGRHSDHNQEIGTFHGGDLKGVIDSLDYIHSLGTDAIWISPIVEQVHGFVGGGESGSFPFYAYHGYWARDFTQIDANFGQDEDLERLVTEAHKRGMKILLDTVLNHPGYATLADLQQDQIPVVRPRSDWPEQWSDWHPGSGENWHSFHQQIDYHSRNWQQWWGKDWVRAGLPGYPKPGSGDITMSLAGLPDFLTESKADVLPPQWLLDNPGTRVVKQKNYTVSDYLIEWQTDWVKRFGIDGYRVDTVKHVGGDVWRRLKEKASASLKIWQKAHHQTGQPFWMMGEVWGLNAYRSPDYDNGFDALINFEMQKKIDKGAACLSYMDNTYQSYADSMLHQSDFNPVSYISSHDTELFFSRFHSFSMQKGAAGALLLTPGAIQVYYGDEVGRDIGPYADDFHQGTRSDMVWQLASKQKAVLKYWQTLGQFRHRHPAVGAGRHQVIPQKQGYVFSRTLDNDKVVVAFVGH